MASLFPAELDLGAITVQVEQLAQLLSEVAAERYALTLRIMLANLRRKVGLPSNGMNTPLGNNMPQAPPAMGEGGMFIDPGTVPPPFTMEELGFAWPSEAGEFSPSSIPLWLQEQSLTDLGLPINGSDGVFLSLTGPNGWTGDFAPMPEAW